MFDSRTRLLIAVSTIATAVWVPTAIAATPVPSAPSGSSGAGVEATSAASAGDQESPQRVPPAVRSWLDKHRDARFDQPDRAARRDQALRRPQPGTSQNVRALYRHARHHIDNMKRFSSRTGRRMAPAAGSSLPVPFDVGQAKALGTWEPLGPGNIGGRTRAVLIDPTNPSVMYAAGVSGGVWKTTNGGGRWRPLTDLLPTIGVSAMAMDPGNSQVIYAGTGEGFFREVVRETALPLRGDGILKTTDGGATWQRLPGTNNANFHWVNKVVVSSSDTRRVYAATREGVFRSLDGGASWSRALNPNVAGGCMDLAIRTDRPTDIVFAACGSFAQSTVYRKRGAETGGSWEVVLRDPGMARTSLALAPSNQNIIYALAAGQGENNNSGVHGLFRSNQGGDVGSWVARVRTTGPDRTGSLLLSNAVINSLVECGFTGPNDDFSFGWYTNIVAVDPTNPDVLFAGGVDFFRSDDGGRTWGPIHFWWAGNAPQNAHADQHAFVFHPNYNGGGNQTVFIGNDGGVHRSDNVLAPRATGNLSICDPNNSQIRWTSLNSNYGVTQFYHGVPIPPNGVRVFGGTQDNGTVLGASNNGWRNILGGDGGYVAVDPVSTNILYAESQNLNLQRSIDGGATWAPATNGISERTNASDEGDNDVLFITPFLLDPNNSGRLWTGGRRLWRSTDRAESWTQASSALNGRISAIAVSPADPQRALVGTDSGFIHRQGQALGAGSATAWPNSRPRSGFVTWLAFDPNDADVAYATYAGFGGRHVWRTTNAGASWTDIDGTGANRVPNIPVHAVLVDPRDARRLYLATDLGVLVSTDRGATWMVENTGFANAVTESLALLTRPNGALDLYAFTHGRGAWKVAASLDGGGGGGCDESVGSGRYCTECGLCDQGEGDCDNDAECASGLVCADNVGAQFGFAPGIDVCVASGGGGGTCSLNPGNGRFCTDCGPCVEGQGDCDNDAECASGLVCADNVGAQFGFAPGIDVCVASGGGGGGTCAHNPGNGRFCTDCGPCAQGEGDCDNDAECGSGLICADNVGAQFGFAPGVDVCVASGGCTLDPGNGRFCTDCGPCGAGQGDCDQDSECQAGLTCVDNVGAQFGFAPGVDVCM